MGIQFGDNAGLGQDLHGLGLKVAHGYLGRLACRLCVEIVHLRFPSRPAGREARKLHLEPEGPKRCIPKQTEPYACLTPSLGFRV